MSRIRQRKIRCYHNGLWKTLGIVFGCTLLFVSMIGAQFGHACSPYQFPKQTPHGLKPWMGPPDGVFVEKPARGIVWGELAISEDQKVQMREQFREFLINSAENWYKEQVIRQDGLSEMHKAPDRILTPEQLEKLFQHKTTMLMLIKLKAEFERLLLSSVIPEIKNLQLRQTAIIETDVTFEQIHLETFAQVSAALSPRQYLHELQVLRL